MKKKIIIISVIIVLILILVYKINISNKKYIEFGYENKGATSPDADIHYQILPQWDYKILKDGSVYYRKNDGSITRDKKEYKKMLKQYDKSYKFIKKLDKDELNKIENYILIENSNKKNRDGRLMRSEEFVNDFINPDYYYAKIKKDDEWKSISEETHINYLKQLIGI